MHVCSCALFFCLYNMQVTEKINLKLHSWRDLRIGSVSFCSVTSQTRYMHQTNLYIQRISNSWAWIICLLQAEADWVCTWLPNWGPKVVHKCCSLHHFFNWYWLIKCMCLCRTSLMRSNEMSWFAKHLESNVVKNKNKVKNKHLAMFW